MGRLMWCSMRHVNDCWSKPPVSVVKANCDASVKGNNFVGIGFVFRDDKGRVLGAGADRILGNLAMDYAEALAVRGAHKFAKDFWFPKLIVESDCSTQILMLVTLLRIVV